MLSRKKTAQIINTKAREPPLIPIPWVKQESWRRHIIEAMLCAGKSMVMTLKPRTHDKTLQRPHDWDHWHLRMNSQEDTILINILLDLRRKLQYIFGYSKAPRSSDSNESRMKSIEVSHKKLWPKHRKSCTLKFSGQHAAPKVKRA